MAKNQNDDFTKKNREYEQALNDMGRKSNLN